MRLIVKDLGDLDEALIVPISDAHMGSRQFNEKKFDSLIDFIETNPKAFGVLVGDLTDNALKNSKSDVYSQAIPISEQKKVAKRKLERIKDKLLGATSGNHEDRSARECGQDIVEDIAESLGVPYDPTGIFIQVKLSHDKQKRNNYTMYFTHGSGGGNTKGAKLNKLYSLRDIVMADVYCMGHLHDVVSTWDEYSVPDTRHNKLVTTIRYFVMSGSTQNWGGYAERLMLNPMPTGFPIIKLSGTKKQVNITI